MAEPGEEPSGLDEETIKAIQDALYDRLREPLLLELRERLVQEVVEQAIPPYYDRFIASEIRRLEEAIEYLAQRISDGQHVSERRFAEAREDRQSLQADMERRFAEAREERQALRAEMERRFAEAREERKALEARIDQLGVQMRNWVLVAVALVSVIVAILQLVLR